MKILTIVSSGYEQGGVENTVVRYTNIFKSRGHDVRILSSDLRPEIQHFSDYEFKAIPSAGFKKILLEFFNVNAFLKGRAILREFSPDIVILHTMQQVTPSVLLLLRKYPAIQCVHGPEAFTTSLLAWHLERSNFKNENYSLHGLNTIGKIKYFCLKYPYGAFYRIALRNVNKYLVFSSYTKELMINDGYKESKISFIPQGVALHDTAPKFNTGSPIIGYAGRLEEYKGVMDLINSMPRILKKVPSAKLSIAGEGSYAEQLKYQVLVLGISKSVKFTGHLNQSQMFKFYSNASIVVMPSTWPETFGKVGVEAMSTGTPVVATAVGGVKDWLEDSMNGYLVAPNNPNQIAKSIINFLGDTSKQEMMSAHARKTAERFTMEKFADNLFSETLPLVAIA